MIAKRGAHVADSKRRRSTYIAAARTAPRRTSRKRWAGTVSIASAFAIGAMIVAFTIHPGMTVTGASASQAKSHPRSATIVSSIPESSPTFSPAPTPTASSTTTLTSTPTPSPSPPAAAPPVVVAIGDSIMKGYGLTPAEAWPAILGHARKWKVTNLGCDGAGFVTVGNLDDCGDVFSGLIRQAVALKPTIVLISGSSNDFGVDNTELLNQTVATVQAIHTAIPAALIIGISTVWGDTEPPAQINDVNEQLRQAITDVQGIYIDIGRPLAGQRELLQDDDTHPTVDGQRVLEAAIAAAMPSPVRLALGASPLVSGLASN
jgi:acyl-CoA thioesterase-1